MKKKTLKELSKRTVLLSTSDAKKVKGGDDVIIVDVIML